MTQQLASQLVVTADASGVEAGLSKAKKSLADLGASAQAAGKKSSAGMDEVGKSSEAAAKKVLAATANTVGSIQRQIAVMQAGARGTREYYTALAQQRGVPTAALEPYLQQLDKVRVKQVAVGVSAKQTAAAIRGVPAQFTDIATSLAGGQNPLTVLLQQGGQLKDMFGGIGPAARALGGYIGGLVNPFTVAAAAAAVLALAYKQGSSEADGYAKALILSGNASGATVNQLQDQARALDGIVGTQSKAAESIAAFAATGDVAADQLQHVTEAAIRLEKYGGQAVEDTVKQFSALAKDPLDASIKLNESTRFLTLSIYQQIKALDDQGRTVEAVALAQRSYADALINRSGDIQARLGLIERGWLFIKDGAKEAWDAMLNIGRPNSLSQQLEEANKALEAAQAAQSRYRSGSGNAFANAAAGSEVEKQRQIIYGLQERVRLESRAASAAKASADQVRARADFDKEGTKYLSDRVRLEREIARARTLGASAGASQSEIDKRVADIRESFAKKGPKPPKPEDTGRTELQARLEEVQNTLRQEVSAYRNSESILEAIRSAGLISTSDYYASKREFIEANTEAERKAAQAQIEALEAENKRLDGVKGKQRQVIDNRAQIAELTARLATVQADATAKLTISGIQEAAALRQQEAAFLTARQAAQDYFDVFQQAQRRDLLGFGLGNRQRAFDSAISQIEERYQAQRRDLENQRAILELEGKFNAEAKQLYEGRLAIIEEFQQKSIASYADYFNKRRAQEADASKGASEALANYLDYAGNVAAQTEALFSRSLGGIEDAFVQLGLTGKASIKDLANTINAEVLRMIARRGISSGIEALGGAGAGSSIAGFINSMLGGSSGAGSVSQAAASTAVTTASTATAASLTTLTAAATAAAAALSAMSATGGVSSGADIFTAATSLFQGFFADGGYIKPGHWGIAGERGAEPVFGGKTGATVVPSGGSSVSISVNVAAVRGMSRDTARQQGAVIGREIATTMQRFG